MKFGKQSLTVIYSLDSDSFYDAEGETISNEEINEIVDYAREHLSSIKIKLHSN